MSCKFHILLYSLVYALALIQTIVFIFLYGYKNVWANMVDMMGTSKGKYFWLATWMYFLPVTMWSMFKESLLAYWRYGTNRGNYFLPDLVVVSVKIKGLLISNALLEEHELHSPLLATPPHSHLGCSLGALALLLSRLLSRPLRLLALQGMD